MSKNNPDDLSNLSMLELFRVETETQTGVLITGLLALERGESTAQQLETLMRAAHSLKGAGRIVNLQPAVRIAHAMEDCFVTAQQGKVQLRQTEIDLFLRGVDLLQQISKCAEADLAVWEQDHQEELKGLLNALADCRTAGGAALTPGPRPSGPGFDAASDSSTISNNTASGSEIASHAPPVTPSSSATPFEQALVPSPSAGTSSVTAETNRGPAAKAESGERFLRLTAENLNRLLGLAGESLVESRWLRPFAGSLERLKRHHAELSQKLDTLRGRMTTYHASEAVQTQIKDLLDHTAECQQFLVERMEELDSFDRRSANLSHRLYLEVLRARMRPFADGTRRFPRMVRDLARSLGKEVRLEIVGENTQVDRDILERLETPLAHLLRNAVDHGCEPPEVRARAGKPPEATIRLEARHSAGMLLVSVADDGGGVDPERVRGAIVQKRLTLPAVAEKFTEQELLEFLFLPGFTLKDTVTEISGRGVGLDVVQNMIKNVRGSIRVSSHAGRGTRFQLQMPLTLSVLRTLLVEVGGEPYALPLAQIARTLKLSTDKIESLEGRPHFQFHGHPVGLLTAHQVLDCGECNLTGSELPIVILGERNQHYGLAVDRFLGERELVVQPLDPRLGKIQDISAAALMEDGSPVLILDVDDVVRSIEKLISGGKLAKVQPDHLGLPARKQKRILAVDDSLTVRELERKLLTSRGYLTDVAIDGMDGWNAVRTHHYDLVITDVDMPRMDGIELATLIKRDAQLKSLPVMIVSYKDREEDRMRGLEAGADYYLTKGSFHDETLLQAVVDLIGEPFEEP